MKDSITKKRIWGWVVSIYVIPIFLSVIMILQWDEKTAILMSVILGAIWVFAVILTIIVIVEAKRNPYPFCYLVDYETLIQYMNEEEKFSEEQHLEAGFHYNFYQNNQKIEVQAWHYQYSVSKEDQEKGNRYYWNNEEYPSLDLLIENHISKFPEYVLIELIETDNKLLNDFRSKHPELDVAKYIQQE